MGQQQLLLIILSAIIVAVAVAIGITIFWDNSISVNRDAMTTDMIQLAVKARHYYFRPKSMGGGGRSFVGLTPDDAGMIKLVSLNFANNANGKYTILPGADASHVIFQGVGTTSLDDGTNFPTIEFYVTQESQVMTQIK
jgi:hypothetical protein